MFFLWCTPEQTVKETNETPVISDAIALIMTFPYIGYNKKTAYGTEYLVQFLRFINWFFCLNNMK